MAQPGTSPPRPTVRAQTLSVRSHAVAMDEHTYDCAVSSCLAVRMRTRSHSSAPPAIATETSTGSPNAAAVSGLTYPIQPAYGLLQSFHPAPGCTP